MAVYFGPCPSNPEQDGRRRGGLALILAYRIVIGIAA